MIYKIKQKHTKHTTIYKMIKMEPKNMKECDKVKKPYKQQTSYDLYIF